jgi:LPXTG-motif cell wall-anchored protein
VKVFRVGRRRRRVALVTGVIAAVVMGLALPASAHSASLSGSTVCFNGDHLVTWHITNSSQTSTLLMTVSSIEAHVGATPYSVTGYSSPLAKGASTDGTSTVPGGVAGTITATLHTTWPDGITDTDTANVTLQDNCVPPTTTTTVEETTTTTVPETTTTVPETTTTAPETTTTVPETTTTVEETTTTTVPDTTTSSTAVQGTTTLFTTTTAGATTTTPITGLGSTTPISGAATTAPGATTLPRTGSSSGYAVFFGLSCLAGGALLLLRRRNWVR